MTPGGVPRGELLRALVRAHQQLIERRTRAPLDPRSERDLAAITERITELLSPRGETPVSRSLVRPATDRRIEATLE